MCDMVQRVWFRNIEKIMLFDTCDLDHDPMTGIQTRPGCHTFLPKIRSKGYSV